MSTIESREELARAERLADLIMKKTALIDRANAFEIAHQKPYLEAAVIIGREINRLTR